MKEILKMLKKRYIIDSMMITLILPYLSLGRSLKGDTLECGFPGRFFTAYLNTLEGVSFHFSISSYLVDVLVIYVVYNILIVLVKKGFKKVKGS